MKKESFCEAEERRFNKLKKFLLPNWFKKVGIVLVIGAILFLIIRKVASLEISETLKYITKRVALIGLLCIAISKEKIEDEMIKTIRGQAFTFAFVFGVVYTLVQPIINYVVGNTLGSTKEAWSDLGDFQVLWFLLTIYIMFFYMIKKRL